MIEREKLLDYLTQGPECFFLVHTEQELHAQSVHALEVSDFGITLNKGIQYLRQSCLLLLSCLWVLYVLVRSDNIFVNLLQVWCGVINLHTRDSLKVAWIVFHH